MIEEFKKKKEINKRKKNIKKIKKKEKNKRKVNLKIRRLSLSLLLSTLCFDHALRRFYL